MPKVTLIMPCYNVADWIEESLDSALRQTLTDIEIIPVDDGSTDDTRAIIKKYASLDDRIHPIFKENGGYGSAVNSGLEKASGEYISILDPDDFIMEDYLWILYNEAKVYDLDVCGVNGYCEIREGCPPNLVTSWSHLDDRILDDRTLGIYLGTAPVNKSLFIFRNNFISSNGIILSSSRKILSDLDFIFKSLVFSKRTKIIRGVGYYKRIQERSDDQITSPEEFVDIFINILNCCRSISRGSKVECGLPGFIIGNSIDLLCGENFNYELIRDTIVRILKVARIEGRPSISVRFRDMLRKIKIEDFDFVVEHICFFEEPVQFRNFKNYKSLHTLLSNLYYNFYYAVLYPRSKYENIAYNQFIGLSANFPSLHKSIPLFDFCNRVHEIEMRNCIDSINKMPEMLVYTYIYLMNYDYNLGQKYIKSILDNNDYAINQVRSTPEIIHLLPRIEGKTEFVCKVKAIRSVGSQNMSRFKEYLHGKSVAVVGNSPSELGMGLGREIDSHDVVVRFNNFALGDKYEDDYGKKTNCWAITPAIETIYFNDDLSTFDYIFMPRYSVKVNTDRVDFYHDLVISGIPYFEFDCHSYRLESDLIVPSLGLFTLLLLRDIVPDKRKISMYAFSPGAEFDGARHYYNDDPVDSNKVDFHNWDAEKRLMKQLSREFGGRGSEV